jgi:HPt (histidine-containing phosphotransfer) domain-containing protein
MECTLDLEAIENLRALCRGQNAGMFAELSDLYLAEAALQLDAMRKAAAGGDAEVLWKTAHTLKGASANLGAEGMRELASRLEKLGRAGQTQEAPSSLEAMGVELDLVRIAFKKLQEAP